MAPAPDKDLQGSTAGERISALESGQQNLYKSLERMEASLSGALDHISRSFDAMRGELQLQSQRISNEHKTNWPVVISGAMLVLAIGASVVGSVMLDVAANANRLHQVQERAIENSETVAYERGRLDAICKGLLDGKC